MNESFFSIIIPVYNAAKFIDKCIKSIFNQEFDDVQVILINDCSTDGSREICNKYKKKYNLNLIEHKHRLGVAISRNDGIKIAKGKYIIFLDSDDFLINNCLIKLKKIILKKKFPNIILNNCERNRVPANYDHLLKYFDNKINKREKFFNILNNNKIVLNECWNLVISRKLITKNKVFFQKIKIIEDQVFIIKIFILMKSIVINQNPILFHRSRLGSLKHTLGVEAAHSYIVALTELCILLNKYSYIHSVKKYLKFRILRNIFYLGSYIVLLNKNETTKLSRRVTEAIKKIGNIKNINYSKSVYSNLKNKKTLDVILNHQKFVKNQVMRLFKKINFKFDGIFIFCADMVAKSVIKILRENKIFVNAIYDDDLNLRGKKMLNTRVKMLPKNNFKISDFKKKIFIICNFDKRIFLNIREKLIKKGFPKKKILHLYF
jgi:glycosyltransferase involved in cell wall biosynthesis